MTTITPAGVSAMEAMVKDGRMSMSEVLSTLGITIAPPEPPEAMVKLAREIALNTAPGKEGMMQAAALAALQYAAKVVRDAPYITTPPGPVVNLYRILRQLGAEQ